MVYCACACRIVHDDGLSEARSLAKASVSVYYGVEHHGLEVCLHLVNHLLRYPRPAVEHGEEYPLNVEVRVEPRLHYLDGV